MFIDPYGLKINWKGVGLASAQIVGGIGTVISGIALASSTGGVGLATGGAVLAGGRRRCYS